MKIQTNIKEKTIPISGRVKIDTYRAGMVEMITPYLEQRRFLRALPPSADTQARINEVTSIIGTIKTAHFIHTAVECPNLIMDSANYGLDIIIQRLVGMNTYSLNITHGEIGTGSTTPALSDTALTTPTNRAAVGFQQDYGYTDAIVQFFFSDSQLTNQTYYEFGTFIDGTSTIGSGQIWNHALLSPAFEKSAGTDVTVECDYAISNSS